MPRSPAGASLRDELEHLPLPVGEPVVGLFIHLVQVVVDERGGADG